MNRNLKYAVALLLAGAVAVGQDVVRGGTVVTGTAPVSVTSGVVSMTAAGAGVSGYLSNVAGALVIDAGFVVASAEPSKFGSGGISTDGGVLALGLGVNGRGGLQTYAVGEGQGQICLSGSGATCYFPVRHDSASETLVLGQATTVTTRLRDASNQGFFSNVGVWSSAYRLAASGATTGTLAFSNTAPTLPVACTTPTITHGTATSFQADVGTTCAAVSTFAFTLPTATNGWDCRARHKTATRAAAAELECADDTTTGITCTNFGRVSGLATVFTDADDIVVSCTGR